MPQKVLQPSFSGGVVAPALWSRTDLAKYATSLRTAKNFYVHAHGGASNRQGTEFIAAAKYADKACRLVPFEFSLEQAYVLEMGEGYVRIFQNGVPVQATTNWATGTDYGTGDNVYHAGYTSGGYHYQGGTFKCLAPHTSGDFVTDILTNSFWVWVSGFETATPYLEADLPELKFAQSADVLFITHPKYCPRMLVRYADKNWALETFSFSNGPFMPSNITKAQTLTVSATTGTGKTLTAASALFDTSTPSKHIGSLWQLRHNIAGQRVSKAFTAAASSTSIRCGKTWRFITGGTWTGSIDIEKSIDGGSTWTIIRGFSGTNDLNINTYGDVDEPCLVRATSPAFTSGTCTANLTSDAYEHTGIVKITAVASSTSATCDVLTEVGATTAVWDWSEGSWSDFRGWPRAVTFHEDRLCFAGTNSEPQTTWTTKTGNYTDFGRSVPLVDSDGISVNLSARKMSGIKHLISLNGMAAMTSATEWSIGYDTNLTPTNTPQKCAGYNGCSDVAPVMVGDRVLYFSPMGSMLKDMAFSLETNGFKSDDMTIMASHLFNGYSIVDMAYQQEPDKLLWCVRSDGKLLTMTYMREQEVFAWTEHNTDGEFESVCSIPGDGYNEVWFVVKRTIGGATVRYIERLAQRMTSTDPAKQVFLDCCKVYDAVWGGTAYKAGLAHLEGRTVNALANGFVVYGLVVTAGAITLPFDATDVVVGLPYVCDFETLNVEMNLNTGTTQGSRVKIADVVVRFLNSRGGKLGPNADSLDDVTMNENVDVTLVEPLHTVDYKQTIQSSYDVGGRIFFRQSDPLPTTILAVIPNVTVGG